MRGKVAIKNNYKKRCLAVMLILLASLYVITGSNSDEIYRLLKNKDIAEGKVHGLIRGIYTKASGKKEKEPEILVTQSGSLK
jgi:hypothetical protein